MDHFEMVEKLREKSGVSYEDAKAALEAANWDLLDAMVILETEGKIAQGAKDYSTRREERKESGEKRHQAFQSTLSQIGSALASAINKGNKIMVNVNKAGDTVFSVPLTVLIILLVFAFWVVLPLLVVGLFFGFTYSVQSQGAGVMAVNHAMDKASEIAGNIKAEVEKSAKEHQQKKGE